MTVLGPDPATWPPSRFAVLHFMSRLVGRQQFVELFLLELSRLEGDSGLVQDKRENFERYTNEALDDLIASGLVNSERRVWISEAGFALLTDQNARAVLHARTHEEPTS